MTNKIFPIRLEGIRLEVHARQDEVLFCQSLQSRILRDEARFFSQYQASLDTDCRRHQTFSRFQNFPMGPIFILALNGGALIRERKQKIHHGGKF